MKFFLGGTLIYLILVLIVLVAIGLIIRKYIIKGRSFLNEYFGTTNLKEALEKTKLQEESTPKSISSMENIYMPRLETDFPEYNINELRSIVEKNLLDYLNGDDSNKRLKSDKIIGLIESRKSEMEKQNIHFNSIRIHQTTLAKYENNNGIATIAFNSSCEYVQTKGGSSKKIQTRFKTELVYIIDSDKVDDNIKALGLNCPNCGAPIKTVGHKTCEYCGSGVVDIVKKNWILNNIKEY